MADKKVAEQQKTQQAVAETQALATTQTQALQRDEVPDYVPTGREGLEGFTKDDVLIPRLVLAQALSPQVTEGDPRYIEGLRPGDLFNSVTGERYGRSVMVQIVRKDNLRAMEFRSIEDGGGVLDPNVPLNDDRLKWGDNGEKPIATLFRDYIARLIPSGELIALSFKSSGIKVAKALNGLIVLRNRPIYTGKYEITTDTELKPQPHKVFKVKNAGFCSADEIAEGREMWLAVKDLDVTTSIDRDTTGEDDSFNYGANANEQPAHQGEM